MDQTQVKLITDLVATAKRLADLSTRVETLEKTAETEAKAAAEIRTWWEAEIAARVTAAKAKAADEAAAAAKAAKRLFGPKAKT